MTATITMTVAAGALNVSREFTMSDADAVRFLAAAKGSWPPRDAGGVPIPSPSNVQIVTAWMRALVSYSKAEILDYEGGPKPAPDLPITETP